MPSPEWTLGGRVRQLPLDINDVEADRCSSTATAYQVAMASIIERAQSPILHWLQSLRMSDLAIVGRSLDRVPEMLHGIGAEPRLLGTNEPDFSTAQVVFVGCPHRHTRLDRECTEAFLDRGGVMITSDKAASLSVLRDFLPVVKPTSPRRVRVAWNTVHVHLWRETGGMSPAVTLEAGHLPLDQAIGGNRQTRVITHDRLTGDPLAVVIQAGNGAIVHSVPHWYQEEFVQQNTALEARPLSNVPRYAGLAETYPELGLGLYRAAETMLTTMLVGLDLACSVVGASRYREAS